LVLVLGAGVSAQPEEAKPAGGLTLYQLPLSSATGLLEPGSLAPSETELLTPLSSLKLTGLAGEVLLARLGVAPPPAKGNVEVSVSFAGGDPAWAESISFLPEEPAETKPIQAGWLTVTVRTQAEPGTYEGSLTVRAGGEQVEVPLAVTLSEGHLGPSSANYLLLSPSSGPKAPGEATLLPGLPPLWPGASAVSFLSLEKQNGDVGLDLSALNAAAEGLTPPFGAEQPLPVFVGPLMTRLDQQFGVEPHGTDYVLACHSILCQLRDWAKGKGVKLIFVPPGGEDGAPPQAAALGQDLVIMRETPEVPVLLPVEPLLSLGRTEEQQFLGLAQAYLVRTREGVLAAGKAGGERPPLWLQVAGGDRLRAGLWAEAVGASVVLVTARGPQAERLSTLASQTDARYLATLKALLARAQESKDAQLKRLAGRAREQVDQLSRNLENATKNPAPAPGDADLDRWRDGLREHIARLSPLLP
jgi:hypothetical protein